MYLQHEPSIFDPQETSYQGYVRIPSSACPLSVSCASQTYPPEREHTPLSSLASTRVSLSSTALSLRTCRCCRHSSVPQSQSVSATGGSRRITLL
jgi:hypothetical protein